MMLNKNLTAVVLLLAPLALAGRDEIPKMGFIGILDTIALGVKYSFGGGMGGKDPGKPIRKRGREDLVEEARRLLESIRVVLIEMRAALDGLDAQVARLARVQEAHTAYFRFVSAYAVRADQPGPLEANRLLAEANVIVEALRAPVTPARPSNGSRALEQTPQQRVSEQLVAAVTGISARRRLGSDVEQAIRELQQRILILQDAVMAGVQERVDALLARIESTNDSTRESLLTEIATIRGAIQSGALGQFQVPSVGVPEVPRAYTNDGKVLDLDSVPQEYPNDGTVLDLDDL